MLYLVVAAMLGSTLLAPADERALRIADEMMEALGGRQNWDEARFIRFTFVRRGRSLDITWDRWTGGYRLDAKNDGGVPYVVLMNVATRQGKAFVEGRPLDGAELSEYLNRAFRIWSGETYWLLMPFKLRDPGVVLRYQGEETIDGTTYDVLHVSFEDVGATPGDEYWAYVNRETRLMDRWKLKLQGGYEGEYRWTNWKRFGGIRLATERVGADGERIRFENILVTDSLPDEVFTSPRPTELP